MSRPAEAGEEVRDRPMTAEERALVAELKRRFRLVGCGCGRYALRNGAELVEAGVVHRANRPCYRQGESKRAGVAPGGHGDGGGR